MRRRILLAILIASCCPKGARGPRKSRLAGPTAVTVEPLAIQEEAKKVDQAVILGTRDGATAIPLSGAEEERDVDVMWVRHLPGGAEGGVSVAHLRARPTGDGKVRVGTFEEFSGGAGHQMRAAVWMSSFIAAQVLGKDLTDYQFGAEYEGFIDGPSAGGLMTVGFIAAMTGAKLDPLATMTGTINPDGTIGPVGGIPHKMAGSAARGKKKLGYPIGQQFDTDLDTREKVDLQEVARSLGVEAREIADVYDAYAFLTGQTLPRPAPLDPGEMALGSDFEQRLAPSWEVWSKLYAEQASGLADGQGMSKAASADLKRALTLAAEAQKFKEQGLVAAAWYKHVKSAEAMAAIRTSMSILAAVQDGDVAWAKQLLANELAAAERTEAAMRAVGALVPGTITDHLLQVSAFQPAIAGWGFGMWAHLWAKEAAAYLDGVQPGVDPDEVYARVGPIVRGATRAQAMAILATQTLELEKDEGLAWRCSLPNARRLAMTYGSAAVANLAYFEAITIEPFANAQHMSMEKATDLVMRYEPRYLVGKWSFQLGQFMKDAFGWEEDSLPAVLSSLSGSMLAWESAAMLVSEYYSLGVNRRADPPTIAQEKAFGYMLAQAEQKAREHAHAAKVAIGQVPLQAKLHYQIGQVLREGDARDKLAALEEFWQASVYAQLALTLARNG